LKRLLLAGGALLALVLALVAFLAFRALARVGTPEFERELVAAAKTALGTEVAVRSMRVEVLRGFRLQGVRIANPAGFKGDLVTASEFRLGYDLWPLLFGRLQIDELAVEKPVIRGMADARGSWNYEGLKVYGGSPGGKASGGVSASFLREFVVSKLLMKDGALTLADANAVFLRMDDLDFESRIALDAKGAGGKGQARVATIALSESLFLRDTKAPIVVSKAGLILDPVSARLADGPVQGRIRLDLVPDVRWAMDLEVKGARVETLLQEAGAQPSLRGRLQATASLTGTGGAATARGRAQVHVDSCEARGQAVFLALAVLLQLPELQSPRFDECRMEFELGGGVARTTLLRFKSRTVELSGKGTFGLATTALDYDLTLGLSPELVAKIPGNPTRAAFHRRDDGFGTIDFGVGGNAAAPKVDLVTRLGASLATEAVKEGVRKLFRKMPK